MRSVTQPDSERRAHGPFNVPAAERNKVFILQALRGCVPPSGAVLEIASGTGQHVVHFAKALRTLIWLPSEPDAGLRESIETRLRREALDNVRAPLNLDVRRRPWPVTEVDAIVCINMIHVAPWAATRALLEGAAEVLGDGGLLFLYGPYRRGGAHTAPSNAAFDARLRAENPAWGVRDLDAVEALGAQAGVFLDKVIEMPANNLSVVFRRGA